MLQRTSAEIIFINTDDPGPVIQKLLEIDYDVEVLKWDWHNGTKPDTTVTVSTITELDASTFFDHVQAIVGPLGGDVIEANLVSSPPPRRRVRLRDGQCRPIMTKRNQTRICRGYAAEPEAAGCGRRCRPANRRRCKA
jgi:hypothetical protein